ncbi:MAG: AraC family transcriptional regulator [Pseudomonas sp.]
MKNESLNPEHFSVAVHFLRLLTDYVCQHGLAIESLLQQAGIEQKSLDDPNGRIPFASFDRLCSITAEALDEPCLGLRLGQSGRPGHLGSFGFALMSCSTAWDLMQQASRYSVLAIDAGHHVTEIRGDECIRYWRSSLPGGAPLSRIQDELNLSAWLTLARWFTNREDMSLNWVSFRHPRPADTRLYEEIFRCPLRFGAAETALGFNAEYLKLQLPHADEKLRRIMDDLCEQLLKQLGNALEPAWLAIARRAVLESFNLGEPRIASVAKATGMSESQLKEQLSQRGLSFRSFIDDLRSSLALGYARDPGLSLVDIAYLLGFSEQSAFQRAFKRWTGMTPGHYRRAHAAPAAEPDAAP